MQPISAKNFYASVQKDLIGPLGLKPANGALATPDDTQPIDFDQASSIVLSLVKDHGKAVYQNDSLANQLAKKVGQRLEKSESWKNGEIDLPACKLAIAEAKASINKELSLHPRLGVEETDERTIKSLQDWARNTENTTVELRLMQVESLVGLAGAGAINQLAIDQLKELLNSVEDFNELAVCVTKLTLLQPQIEQVLGKASQGYLEQNIAQAHARLSDPAKVESGLNKWVNQAPSEQEKAARQKAADQILTSLKAHIPVLELNVRELTNLPAEIGALSHLKLLRVIYGKFKSLPDSIGCLNSLQAFTLLGSQVQSLPDSIGQLSNLQELTLDNNQLQSLPDSIGQLSNLKDFKLDESELRSLPDSMSRLNLDPMSRIEIVEVQNRLDIFFPKQNLGE